MLGLQFYIELEGSNPKVWRRIVVPFEFTFYKFHLAIQGAFGWDNYHMFHFSENSFLDKVSYSELTGEDNTGTGFQVKDAKRSKIKLVFVKKKEFVYIYDFGSKWFHQIVLEKCLEEEIEKPYCINAKGACPPEDCGGLGGYIKLLNEINTTNQFNKETYIEMPGLAPGEKWDAHFCSIREINKRLCLLE